MRNAHIDPSTVAFTLVAAVAIGCARSNPSPELSQEAGRAPADSLVGNWVLRAEPPLPPPGINLTVTIDSSHGDRVFGRLSHLFTGNVGTDTREYQPFAGSVNETGGIEFTIEKRDPSLLGLSVAGQISGDTLKCHELTLGPDELGSDSRVWFFVREER